MSSLAVSPVPKAPISPEHPVPRQTLVDPITRFFSKGNLISQMGIIVTGSFVRLTGSGLGCSDWPLCVEGSITPVEATTWHPYIEFGNRLLSFILIFFAVGLVWTVMKRPLTAKRPKSLHYLAMMPIILTILQVFVGGVSVWLDLTAAMISPHYLLSAALVAFSVFIDLRLNKPDVAPRPIGGIVTSVLAWAIGLSAAVVLFLGTIVTGAGPHTGDAGEVTRFPIDIFRATQLHSISVWIFVVLITVVFLRIRKKEDPIYAPAQFAWWWLYGVVVLQGIIGYTQFFLSIPALLVGIHVFGSALFIAATTWALFTLYTRRPMIAICDLNAA